MGEERILSQLKHKGGRRLKIARIAEDVKSSKSFCKHLNSKRKGKKSMMPLVWRAGELVTQDT